MRLKYYHITAEENMDSIIQSGLVRNNGRVYVANSIGRVLDIWDQMVEEGSRSGNPVVLEVRIEQESLIVDSDADYDCWFSESDVPSKFIRRMWD
jgi:RNA:NAD 2'-phosphotransferase (TPT1/KptA family)